MTSSALLSQGSRSASPSTVRPRIARTLAWLAVAVVPVLLAGCIPGGSASSASATGSAIAGDQATSAAPAPRTPAPPLGAVTPGDPDPVLTPGATNPNVTQARIGTTICSPGFTRTIRPPASYTGTLKRRQIVRYGYADTNPADFEEDHLVSLELGGAPRDPANLWPEPHHVLLPDGTDVGWPTKDRFENWLNDQVCHHGLSLAEAQREIATDWVGAWQAAGRP